MSEFLHEKKLKKRKPRVQNVSSFGGSTPEPPLTSNFVFLFSLILLLPFFLGLSFNWPHTLKDLDFSVFLSHSSSHSSSSSCVITTHRHSKEFKFIIFFLPSFVHFAREDELFWFSFLFVIVDEISFFNTRILCCPFRHSTFFFWMNFVPCHVDKSSVGLVPEKNACVVSCRITRSFHSRTAKRMRRDDDFTWRCVYT